MMACLHLQVEVYAMGFCIDGYSDEPRNLIRFKCCQGVALHCRADADRHSMQLAPRYSPLLLP